MTVVIVVIVRVNIATSILNHMQDFNGGLHTSAFNSKKTRSSRNTKNNKNNKNKEIDSFYSKNNQARLISYSVAISILPARHVFLTDLTCDQRKTVSPILINKKSNQNQQHHIKPFSDLNNEDPCKVSDLSLAMDLLQIENWCLLQRPPIDPCTSSKMSLPSYCKYLQNSYSQ